MAGIRFKPTLMQSLDVDGLVDALTRVQNETADNMLADYEAVVGSWETNVVFQKFTYINADDIIVAVLTDSQVFGWVNDGTQAHPIAPRHAKAISYQVDFTPKTTPGVVSSQPGGKSGPYITYPKGFVVQHPGTEARHFDKVITEKHEPAFQAGVNLALRRFNQGVF